MTPPTNEAIAALESLWTLNLRTLKSPDDAAMLALMSALAALPVDLLTLMEDTVALMWNYMRQMRQTRTGKDTVH